MLFFKARFAKMMDDDKRDDRAAAGLSDNRRGGGAMAESNVCRLERLVEDLTAEQKQELAALQAVYDSALPSAPSAVAGISGSVVVLLFFNGSTWHLRLQ